MRGQPPQPPSCPALSAAPAMAPQNVQVNPLTASQLEVTWEPPPAGSQNGNVQGYKAMRSRAVCSLPAHWCRDTRPESQTEPRPAPPPTAPLPGVPSVCADTEESRPPIPGSRGAHGFAPRNPALRACALDRYDAGGGARKAASRPARARATEGCRGRRLLTATRLRDRTAPSAQKPPGPPETALGQSAQRRPRNSDGLAVQSDGGRAAPSSDARG